MVWYEVLALILSLSGFVACIYFVCLYDYKYKLKRLEYETQKSAKLDNQLSNIIDILNEKKGD